MTTKTNQRYCYICGKKMLPVWTGKYDTKTGKKKYFLDCDVKDCRHGYHIYPWYKSFSLFCKCKICNYEWVAEL